MSEKHFRQSIKNAPIPVIMQAENGEVIEISKTWTELTGYTRDEMKTVNDWLNLAFGHGAHAVRNMCAVCSPANHPFSRPSSKSRRRAESVVVGFSAPGLLARCSMAAATSSASPSMSPIAA